MEPLVRGMGQAPASGLPPGGMIKPKFAGAAPSNPVGPSAVQAGAAGPPPGAPPKKPASGKGPKGPVGPRPNAVATPNLGKSMVVPEAMREQETK